MTPDSLVKAVRLLALAASVVGVWLVLGPFHIPDGWDKLVHAGAFYGFTLTAMFCMPWNRRAEILQAVVAIAISSEVAQALTGRNASLVDLAADAAGVALAALPFYVADFRSLAQRHRYLSFAQLRAQDRRRRQPSRARATFEA